MTRNHVRAALTIMLCLTVSLAYGQRRGGGARPPGGSQGERKPEGRQPSEQPGRRPSGESQGPRGANSAGGKAPGGEWSERTHGGKQSAAQSDTERNKSGAEGAAAGAAASKNKSPQASGAEGAAAGAAASNRNSPQASGAEGAAAGAAAANRKAPPVSGAEGAAAGAAASNRNAPAVSGAQGAAAGAAAANRNAPPVSGAAGAAAGAAVANNNAPAVSGADGAAAGYAAANSSFNNPNLYGQQWYGAHPGAFAPAGWAAGAAWTPVNWGAIAGHCGYSNVTPISYDYGVNVTAQNGNVVVNGQNVGTTEEFSQQAADMAASGAAAETAPTDQWLPLGVFAMVRNEQQHPQFIMQLAINKQGILRGNYTDEITDHTLPIHGAADKNTQRVAWTVGENKQNVMEAGLNDLTENAVPALMHKNGKTDHWLLVRLAPPQQAGDTSAGSGDQK